MDRRNEIGGDWQSVGQLVVQGELGPVVGGDRADRLCGQGGEQAQLGIEGGPGGDLGDLDCLVVAAGPLNGGVDTPGAYAPNTVSDPNVRIVCGLGPLVGVDGSMLAI